MSEKITKACKYCGKQVGADTNFCWYCNRELEARPERPEPTPKASRAGWALWALLGVLALGALIVFIGPLVF